MTDTLLNKREAAQLLTISTSTLDRFRKRHAFPKPMKIGGTLRWHHYQIAAWRDSQ